MTSGDAIGWGLAVLLWLGITAGAVALAFAAVVLGALAVNAVRGGQR